MTASTATAHGSRQYRENGPGSGFIIEFFGLSGVGKTTLATALSDKLYSLGMPFHSHRGKSLFFTNLSVWRQRLHALEGWIHNPVGICRVAINLLKAVNSGRDNQVDSLYKQRLLLKWLKRWAMYIYSVNSMRNSGGLYVLDRGVCTNLLSITTRVEIDDIQPLGMALAAAGAFPDLLIAVEAHPESIAARRRMRGDQKKFWQSDWNNEYRKYVQVRDLADKIFRITGGRLIRVSAETPVSVTVNSSIIIDALPNFFNNIGGVV